MQPSKRVHDHVCVYLDISVNIRESDVSLPIEQEDISGVLTRLRQLKDRSLVQLVTGSVQISRRSTRTSGKRLALACGRASDGDVGRHSFPCCSNIPCHFTFQQCTWLLTLDGDYRSCLYWATRFARLSQIWPSGMDTRAKGTIGRAPVVPPGEDGWNGSPAPPADDLTVGWWYSACSTSGHLRLECYPCVVDGHNIWEELALHPQPGTSVWPLRTTPCGARGCPPPITLPSML